MDTLTGSDVIKVWPPDSREAAELVIRTYGEPHEACATQLMWRDVGPWKRIVASREFHQHDFPAPHIDAVESFIDYRVPVEACGPLAEFDGSVMVDGTAGEVSARCHDEQANLLALNLMHDIVRGAKTPQEARDHYAREFLDSRRHKPTPYMDGLRFSADDGTADPDERILSEHDLDAAVREGEQSSQVR
jgi:hypothetical protein